MIHIILRLILVLFAGIPSVVLAINMAVIHLQSQTVNKLIPMIQPQVPQATLSGTDQTLIVSGSQDDVVAVKSLVKTLDLPIQQYTVQFVYSDKSPLDNNKVMRTTIVHETVARDEYNDSQTITVNDGETGQLMQQHSFPILSVLPFDQYVGGDLGWTYQDATSQVLVHVKRLGDKVTLVLSTDQQHLNRIQQSNIETKALSTVITLPIGEWVPLGGSGPVPSDNERRVVVHETGDRQLKKSYFWVRVDRAS